MIFDLQEFHIPGMLQAAACTVHLHLLLASKSLELCPNYPTCKARDSHTCMLNLYDDLKTCHVNQPWQTRHPTQPFMSDMAVISPEVTVCWLLSVQQMLVTLACRRSLQLVSCLCQEVSACHQRNGDGGKPTIGALMRGLSITQDPE